MEDLTSRFKDLVSALDYEAVGTGIASKTYHDGTRISVDFENHLIDYPEDHFTLGDKTTSNFSHPENLVVLECVDRLLSIGYKANCLTLEKRWKLGRGTKGGKADIIVNWPGVTDIYMIIECKTDGDEYQHELKNMASEAGKGGQLFSYFQQELTAEYLILYSSRLGAASQGIENAYSIVDTETIKDGFSTVEERFTRWDKQFSHVGIFDEEPYKVTIRALKKKDLNSFQESSESRTIFNQFAEILRHNVVSDKPNAFNKIFNLFLCKIVDENKADDETLDFQWIRGEDSFESLFDRLNSLYKRGMSEYLNKDITDISNKEIEDVSDQKAKELLKKLRLYKNQEFAFNEVYNEDSFDENAKIVKEVVVLLQTWKLRYEHKQQFLGDFFELLLGAGFKQEAGQFFTPVPLTRFILHGLPLSQIVNQKALKGKKDFLPYLIDPACGSGHFLTEAMDVFQSEIIDRYDASKLNKDQRNKLHFYQGEGFEWAKEFVYGVEKDYRLVKTTKLACFLHGDGEANIINASGLAPFSSKSYQGVLARREETKENPVFDVFVSNPPYSISAFKATVNGGESAFDLYNSLTDNSSEIEALFVERMCQIVCPGGWSAIILPSSILSNSGIYSRARRLYLENFDLKSVVLLSGEAFMATGTNTVVLYGQKRSEKLSLKSAQDYKTLEGDLLVVSIGSGQVAKSFLGYSFSNRRGSEGIIVDGEGLRKEASDMLRCWNEGAKRPLSVPDVLKSHAYIKPFQECLNYETEKFSNKIDVKKKLEIKSCYPLVELREVLKHKKGASISKAKAAISGNIPVIAGGQSSPYNHNKSNNEGKPCITVSASGAYAGFLWYHTSPIWASDATMLFLRGRDSLSYIYYILKSVQWYFYLRQTGNAQPHIKFEDVSDTQIPLPSLEEQEQIVSILRPLDEEKKALQKEVEEWKPTFEIDPSWKRVRLEDVTTLGYGVALPHTERVSGQYPVYGSNGIIGWHNKFLLDNTGQIIVGRKGSAGEVHWSEKACTPIDTTFYVIIKNNSMIKKFACYLLKNLNLTTLKSGNGSGGINRSTLYDLAIPLPPLEEQHRVVSRLEAQEKLIEQKKQRIRAIGQEVQGEIDKIFKIVED